MDRKYQIFLSSTYEDLRDQREAIVKAILEMGHIPVGMEMFSAADEEQWRIITSHIDRSDYYVVIVAHRYGSTIDGLSYTEMEYDYAARSGIPILGFVIEPAAAWPNDRIEMLSTDAVNSFKRKLKTKPVGFWSSTEQLAGQVAIALTKQMTAHPRPGWIRGDQAAGPEVLAELARLSSENAELRKHLDDSGAIAEAKIVLDSIKGRIGTTDLVGCPIVSAQTLSGVAGKWLRVDFQNSSSQMMSQFTFQPSIIIDGPIIRLESAVSVGGAIRNSVKKVQSSETEVTYLPNIDFSLLPGAWGSFWIGIFDDDNVLSSPIDVIIRIFTPAGTKDFPLRCVL